MHASMLPVTMSRDAGNVLAMNSVRVQRDESREARALPVPAVNM